MAQLGDPISRDWVSQTLADLEELEVDIELEATQKLQKICTRKLLKKQLTKKHF